MLIFLPAAAVALKVMFTECSSLLGTRIIQAKDRICIKAFQWGSVVGVKAKMRARLKTRKDKKPNRTIFTREVLCSLFCSKKQNFRIQQELELTFYNF